MHVDEISTFGRHTQGVRLMRLADDVKVVSIALTERYKEDETEEVDTETETGIVSEEENITEE